MRPFVSLLLLAILAPMHAAVNDIFDYDGFTYSILSETPKEVELIGAIDENNIPTNLTIPSIAQDSKGTTYSVVSIKEDAFTNNKILHLTIPSSVRIIKRKAFQNSSELLTLTLNEGLGHISASAFQSCSKLKKVTIPSTVKTMENLAFYVCRAVEEYHFLSTTPPSIEVNTFGGDTHATYYIPNGSRPTYEQADKWKDLPLLEEDEKTILHDQLLYRISNYYKNEVTLNACLIEPTELNIPDTFTCQSPIDGKETTFTVTAIDGNIFPQCETLTSVSIPGTVKTIGSSTFSNCKNLTSLTLGEGIEEIGAFCFRFCPLSDSITIPSTIQYIGMYAFNSCPNVKIFHLKGKTPPKIGADVFTNTQENSEYTNAAIIIPCDTKETYIASNTQWGTMPLIEDCEEYFLFEGLRYVVTNADTKEVELVGASKLPANLIIPDKVTHNNIEYKVTSIAGTTFRSNKTITSVSIPATVKTIGANAFQSCTNITSITIADGVETIETGAFQKCNLQGVVTIPQSVRTIGNRVFLDCTSVKAYHLLSDTPPTLGGGDVFRPANVPIFVPCNAREAYLTKDYWEQYLLIEDCELYFEEDGLWYLQPDTTKQEVTLIGASTYPTALNIPTEVVHKKILYAVTSVGAGAFKGVTDIKNLSIPASVKNIGDNAFDNCTNLTTLTIAEGVEQIGSATFQRCGIQGEITLPASIQSIGGNAFFACNKVTAYRILSTIPPTIKGSNVFSPIYTPIFIPCNTREAYQKASYWSTYILIETCDNYFEVNGLRYLQTNPQKQEVALIGASIYPTTLNIPTEVVHNNTTYTVTTIGKIAFKTEKTIQAITIPSTIDTIQKGALEHMDALTAVSIEEGVIYIDDSAFGDNFNLTEITLPSSVKYIGAHAFRNARAMNKMIILSTTPPTINNPFRTDGEEYTIFVPCSAVEDYQQETTWNNFKHRIRGYDCTLSIYHSGQGGNGDVETFMGGPTGKIEYHRTFPSGTWHTLYLPFDLAAETNAITLEDAGTDYNINQPVIKGIQDGYFYLAELTPDGNSFTFTQDKQLKGRKPYIIYFKDPYYDDKIITFHSKENNNDIPFNHSFTPNSLINEMVGNETMMPQSVAAPMYIYQPYLNEFRLIEAESATLNPFECYVSPLRVPNIAMLPRAFSLPRIPHDDTPTGCIPTIQDSPLTCYIDGNTLHVLSDGQTIHIYSSAGTLLHSYDNNKHIEVSLPKGYYIVHTEGYSQKVIL